MDPKKFGGVILDDTKAKIEGRWAKGQGLKPYFYYGYRYTNDPSSYATFTFEAPKSGKFDIRIAYQPHPNRGKSVPIEVLSEDHTKKTITLVNMTQKPSFENGFHSVRKMTLTKGEKVNVRIFAKGAKGNVHLDAAQLLPID